MKAMEVVAVLTGVLTYTKEVTKIKWKCRPRSSVLRGNPSSQASLTTMWSSDLQKFEE